MEDAVFDREEEKEGRALGVMVKERNKKKKRLKGRRSRGEYEWSRR